MTKKKITPNSSPFHLNTLNFMNETQKLAYGIYQQHDVVFFTGPAGTGKTFLATAFAIAEVLRFKTKNRIILTRPVVEAGEQLGFLPGTLEEKINPYVLPVYDCIRKLIGGGKEVFANFIQEYVEIAPLAYMRGRTFSDAICIFDEAQNATTAQLKLFLTRFGKNSKVVVTGDPKQSDLGLPNVPLVDVVHRVETVPGIGIVRFSEDAIVRHPLIAEIIKRLEA
jgi:phosphate starvation-inducible PhoH-like protein